MTDYQRELWIGEQQVIRRGPKPPGGWIRRTVIDLEEGQTALLTGGAVPRKKPRGGSGGGTVPTPPPPDPVPPDDPATGFGYFTVAGGTGGSLATDIFTPAADAQVINVSTFSQLQSALLQSNKRYIKVTGSAVLDGAGADFKVTNGNFTVDGRAYTGGGMKDYKIVHQCSNVIWAEMKLAPGEGTTAGKSADRRAMSFNGGNSGTVLDRILVYKCSLAWGPDVVMSMINNVEDSAVVECLIGPALLESNIASSPNGYGFNVTTPGNSDPATIYVKRLTVYRNLFALNKQRNLKYEHADGVDAVNNVVYDWGNQAPVKGNARGLNVIGNIFKKGPETQASNAGFEEDSNYAQYASSTYQTGNIGVTAAGGSFTIDWSDISGARGTAYDGGPTDADHGPLTVATADGTLFTAVVAAAGRTYQDATDTLIKGYATDGDSAGYYNGASGSSPHPSWS